MFAVNAGRKSLARLAKEFGSDKAKNCDVYEQYLAALRDRPVNLFEIGVGGYKNPRKGGASVRMWKTYFERGSIYALDYFDKSPHVEERIAIFRGDQGDPVLLNTIADRIGDIDVIVDDGSHISLHIIISFEALFPRLRSGGLYIVEDVGTSYWPDHGGSEDLNAQTTSMAYFKRLADGINHKEFKNFKEKYVPSYADQNTAFLHFYPNFIVVKKK